jgi:tRNA modification GTPase
VRGVPLNIIDTAGLRDTDDEVERIGIARTWEAVAQADVVLHLVAMDADGCASNDVLAAAIAQKLPAGVPVLRVVNKIDRAGAPARLERDAAGQPAEVWLSAREGQGVELLREALLELAGWQSTGESVFIARERHLAALRAAQAHLDRAAERAGQGDRQLDLFAEELRLAQERLGEITGEFSADDLLGVIFGRFCIGK